MSTSTTASTTASTTGSTTGAVPGRSSELAEAIRAVGGPSPATAHRHEGRAWALWGLASGLLGAGVVVASTAAGQFAYSDGDPVAGMVAARGAQIAFHGLSVVTAVVVLVFAAGLQRHLAGRTRPGSLAPVVAAAGLGLVSVVLLLGSGLDTEVVNGPAERFPEYLAGGYGHWIGTIPWCWLGAGAAALAVAVAGLRDRAVSRWLAVTSLVLGGLGVLLAASPLQYLCVAPAVLWLLVASTGLLAARRR